MINVNGRKFEKLNFEIELINGCNYRCAKCPHASRDDKTLTAPFDRKYGNMNEEVFMKSLEWAKSYAGCVRFSFFGEQTLHPKFKEYMSLLKKHRGKYSLLINTTGSTLTEDLSRVYIDTQFTRVNFSFDSMDQETYMKTQKPLFFKDYKTGEMRRDVENIFEVSKEKLHTWLKIKKRPETRIVFVVTEHNKKQAKAFKNYWSKYLTKKDHIIFKQVLSFGGKVPNKGLKSQSCDIWKSGRYFIIAYNGDVTPCNLDTNLDLKIGNIMTNSPKEIYESIAYQKIRSGSINKNIVPCSTCVDANFTYKNEYVYGK